jgi:hypothetical protein
MLSGSYNIDKYILPNFINIFAIVPMINTNKYCKNIINYCKKFEKINRMSNVAFLKMIRNACKKNNVNCIKLLIKISININKLYLIPPLHIECFNGSHECAKILISCGVDVNMLDICGCTALHDACKNGSSECVKLLLDANVNVNILDNFGRTALDIAIKNKYQSCINLLKQHMVTKNM